MKRISILFILAFIMGCSGSKSSSPSSSLTADSGSCSGNGDGGNALPTVSGTSNVLPITINGLSICSYNQPCATVTVCNPGTSTCHTIDNLLIDTGSYGLRIFDSALTAAGITATQVTTSGNNLAECMNFGSANTWGPVKTVDLKIAGEATLSNFAIQVINSSYASVPSACSTPFAPADTPSNAGFNGILGVGLGIYDCGTYCVSHSDADVYFSCSGSTCTSVAASLASQVLNPVSQFSSDNNGTIIELPSISSSGLSGTTGRLIFGIGTQANNTVAINSPSSTPQVFQTDGYGDFTTTFAGLTMSSSFIDSGSNAFFFPQTTQTPTCDGSSDFFCPSNNACLAATMKSASTSSPTQATVSFTVTNIDNLSASAFAINGLSGESGDQTVFDWGLPFFYGRTVYTGIVGKTSTGFSSGTATGPFWAF